MNKYKKSITSIIIFAIIIMIIALTIFGNFLSEDKNQSAGDLEDSDKLEFTIDIVDCPYDLENKSIYFQFKNIHDKPITFSGPETGKSLDFIIKAENGTEYHYAGPITYGGPWWKTLSLGEIEDGHQWFGFKIYTFYASGINYTWWQNSTSGESWFFQPGTYEIYGEYESKPNNDIENIIVGIWHSNVITLTIE